MGVKCHAPKDTLMSCYPLLLKDVHAKIFYLTDFFEILLWTNNDILVSENEIKAGGHQLHFRDKACGRLV